jgi:hypothetical protein
MYRDDVEALAARHAVIATEVAALERERDAAAQRLREAKTRAKLPVLDDVRVASPCKMSWAGMAGDDRVRHCAHCNQDVFNLSGMTRDEAEALLLSRGNLCIRYYRRADGTILLTDCTIGGKRKRARRNVVAGLALVAGTAVGGHEYSEWANRPRESHQPEIIEEVGAKREPVEFREGWDMGGAPGRSSERDGR